MKKKKIQVCFMIDEDAVALIDYYGQKIDRSRSQMVRNLVMSGLDDAKILNALGVFDVVKLSNWMRRGRQKSLPLDTE